MQKNRLEALTDGVVAVIITIIVLDLRIPQSNTLHGLAGVAPIFLAYALAFTNVGLYWNNHHHVLHASEHINGKVMWSNMLLLFWLSLLPFTIRWMDEGHFASMPVAAYGVAMMGCGVGYMLLERTLIAANPQRPTLEHAVGADHKAKLSLVGYIAAVGLAFVAPWIAIAIYVAIAVSWFIPDRRIEKALANERRQASPGRLK